MDEIHTYVKYKNTFPVVAKYFDRALQVQQCLIDSDFRQLQKLIDRWYGVTSIFHYLNYFDLFLSSILYWPVPSPENNFTEANFNDTLELYLRPIFDLSKLNLE